MGTKTATKKQKTTTGSYVDYVREFYPEFYGIQEYEADKCAAFSKVVEEWGVFGNFAPVELDVDGVKFSCTERLYQCMRFKTAEPALAVYNARQGLNIKQRARHFKQQTREDWGSMFIDAMKFCLMKKYENNDFKEKLESSKGLFIVENQTSFPRKNADTWGVKLSADGKKFVGPNVLGRLLMELRDNGKLEYKLPADALSFIEFIIKNNKGSSRLKPLV